VNRRQALQAAGAAGLAGASGAVGWAARGSEHDRPNDDERVDETGLGSGRAGAFGIHRIVYSVPVDGRYAALTFDDGPDPRFTPRVLEILKSYGIRATFCVMGYNALHHPDLLKATVADGHEIGNHTWTHRDLSTVGLVDTTYEIRRGREVIEEVTGQKIRFFRPPRGEMSGAALRIAAQEGNDILMWSITGSVPGHERTAVVEDFVLSKLEPGAIIDYHDGIGRGTFDPTARFAQQLIARRTAEVQGLPRVIETALQRGYQFMRVSDLLEREVPGKPPTNTPDESADADTGERAVAAPPDATLPAGDTTIPPPT
jgi:peptidoglycan/xylan/chitin deacetylase (PgdA/CDA1 family)